MIGTIFDTETKHQPIKSSYNDPIKTTGRLGFTTEVVKYRRNAILAF